MTNDVLVILSLLYLKTLISATLKHFNAKIVKACKISHVLICANENLLCAKNSGADGQHEFIGRKPGAPPLFGIFECNLC